MFVWELEPLGDDRYRHRTAREWVESHIREWSQDDFESHFGEIAEALAFQVVFTGTIESDRTWTVYGDEYDEEIYVDTDMLTQEVPEERFHD